MVLSQVFAVTQQKSQKHPLAAERRVVERGRPEEHGITVLGSVTVV